LSCPFIWVGGPWCHRRTASLLCGKNFLLDLRKAAGFTDYFLICSGTNPRQIRAIADSVMEALAAEGATPAHVEGYDRSEWVLLDYFDFIVHVFAPETRAFYSLERLWGNAEKIEVVSH